MAPKISVILSVFNGEHFLRETVESILNQSFGNLEFIIIDDGSVDNSWPLLQYYQKMDSRIALMRNTTNKGEAYSINLGMHRSRSHLIAISQCGAISYESRLEEQYKLFRAEKECVLVGAQATYCDIEGKTLQDTFFPSDDEDIRRSLYIGRIVFEHPSVMFRKFDGISYREDTFPEPDFDFWLRISFNGKLRNIDEVLVKRIIHPKRISLTRKYEQKKMHWCIHKLFYERLRYGEERSTWCQDNSGRKHRLEPFKNRMLHILSKRMFETRGFLHYCYLMLSLMFSPAPGKEIYYWIFKRALIHFYSDKLLKKYLGMGETAGIGNLG
jgi:glycosyltransferase involved in cell wall biosynthesis